MTCFENDSDPPQLALSLAKAAQAISVSEKTLWTLSRAGTVPFVRIGRRLVFPVRELQDWLGAQAKGGLQA